MEWWEVLVQQTINGLTRGAVFALIALGYTMVYGIIQLINFAHGDVFMIGTMLALTLLTWAPGFFGSSQAALLPPAALAGLLVLTTLAAMAACGALNVLIE